MLYFRSALIYFASIGEYYMGLPLTNQSLCQSRGPTIECPAVCGETAGHGYSPTTTSECYKVDSSNLRSFRGSCGTMHLIAYLSKCIYAFIFLSY